jgi:glutathione S-transferase
MFWTWPSRARDRAEIKRLSGRRTVPILVLDDGDVVSGSGSIARWARANAARSGERAN